jgi:hypothetical protein
MRNERKRGENRWGEDDSRDIATSRHHQNCAAPENQLSFAPSPLPPPLSRAFDIETMSKTLTKDMALAAARTESLGEVRQCGLMRAHPPEFDR